jgi:glutamate--cysteine ligase
MANSPFGFSIASGAAFMSIPQSGGGTIESKDQLAEYLAAGCKPKSEWRIGTEHEKFGFDKSAHMPLPYDGPCSIKAMLDGLRDGFGWSPIEEAGHIIGLTRNGANVSLEPGGQFELSGAPLRTIQETADELDNHLAEVRTVAERIGAGFMGLGAAPIWTGNQVPVMPKGRYALMTRHMGNVGTHGTQMMYRTCTVQVNLDFASEADMVRKMRVALALQPIATALFACSPFFEGKDSGYQSWRARIWQDTDKARTGMLPFVFENGMGFERWVEYALDVPMYFVYRDGKYIDALGMSFRDFLVGKLPALPGEIPTLSDWADHLTTAFPEARLKKFIEMRGADAGPVSRLNALPAMWVGLIYDQGAMDAAWDICKNWTLAEREQLRLDAAKLGLKAQVAGRSVQSIAKEVLAVARAGLEARGLNEAGFLDPMDTIADSGVSAADALLTRYANGDLDRIYEDNAY